MTSFRRGRWWLGCVLALGGLAGYILPASAASKLDDFRALARQAEKEGNWAKACSYYAYLLNRDRGLSDIKERFQTCLRHFHRTRRHQDPSYRKQVLTQDIGTALKVYGEVLEQVRVEYLEEGRADLTRLFRQGAEELRLALRDQAFLRQYLPQVKSEAVQRFLAHLQSNTSQKKIKSILDAQAQVLQWALAAKKDVGLPSTLTVLEFACGACNALDEHTYYLTPRQFGEDAAVLRGDPVGVGIELASIDHKLVISHVYLQSPASRAGLAVGDRVTRIGGVAADRLTLEKANEKLKGKIGTALEMEVVSLHESPRAVSLLRQPLQVSVVDFHMLDVENGIGFVQIAAFNEHTLAELDAAVQQLEMQGMKSLVLDVRGSPGGLWEAGVRVAERFLGEGSYIVGTQGRGRELRRFSHNMNPWLFSLVVLVDGGTASAAEVVAGALKDNGRATLIGQATFGKSSMQHIVELKTVQAGGIRITWAKFATPLQRGDTGIVPHLTVQRTPASAFDEQVQAAISFLIGRMP